jgi:hypothetical protein
MHIFIDESGTFTLSGDRHSISVVGALIVPDHQLPKLERKWARMRPGFTGEADEVKGRSLSERSIRDVVSMLRSHEVIFEVSAIDMGLHDAATIARHQSEQAERFTTSLTDRHSTGVRAEMADLGARLRRIPPQLYVQSAVTFSLIHRTIEVGSMYFSQRRPEELASFHWVIDAKSGEQITEWERWWSFVVMPVLQSMSLREGLRMFAGGDYSHFERFSQPTPDYLKAYTKRQRGRSDGKATDLRKLMTESFRFSGTAEPGLELADIVVNATRRGMTHRLAKEGWNGIADLMIQRADHSIEMLALGPIRGDLGHLPYTSVLDHFRVCGRDMIAPRFRRGE